MTQTCGESVRLFLLLYALDDIECEELVVYILRYPYLCFRQQRKIEIKIRHTRSIDCDYAM